MNHFSLCLFKLPRNQMPFMLKLCEWNWEIAFRKVLEDST